jgi:hypothetical protein
MKSSIPAASAEFASADFGDERLTRRLMRIADCVAAAPSSGFPEITRSDGELEGVYRFLGNERVTPLKILAPHFASTIERTGTGDLFVVHDTTEFGFGGTAHRDGLGRINKVGEKQGFFGHFALAVASDGSRRPLGLVGLKTHVRTGRPTARYRHARQAGTENERTRWFRLALDVGKTLPRAIHIMDREADSYEIASELIGAGARFVIRVCRDRKLIAPPGAEKRMFAAADRGPIFATRTVPIARRRGRACKRARKIHPPRDERVATLQLRASAHVVERPNRRALDNCSPSLALNVVLVDEVNPPPDAEPISWKLVTTEPINTAAQVEAVVDAYRARWVIEEYFKALKTGCSLEKRQLESFRTLVNALAIFSVMAWRLLLLRSTARLSPDAPATNALTERQVQVLQELSRMRDTALPRIDIPASSPTAQDALLAVAQLGGHIKNNGPPGWQVLGRGYESLLLVELGWRARETCDR